jgi:hypothetical protein
MHLNLYKDDPYEETVEVLEKGRILANMFRMTIRVMYDYNDDDKFIDILDDTIKSYLELQINTEISREASDKYRELYIKK